MHFQIVPKKNLTLFLTESLFLCDMNTTTKKQTVKTTTPAPAVTTGTESLGMMMGLAVVTGANVVLIVLIVVIVLIVDAFSCNISSAQLADSGHDIS